MLFRPSGSESVKYDICIQDREWAGNSTKNRRTVRFEQFLDIQKPELHSDITLLYLLHISYRLKKKEKKKKDHLVRFLEF